MTKRDIVWDCAFQLGLGIIDPDELWDEDAWWNSEGMFCHWHIRKISKLGRSNKRTINRTLNQMVELGWLEKHELDEFDGDSQFLSTQPYLYELSDFAKDNLSTYPDLANKDIN